MTAALAINSAELPANFIVSFHQKYRISDSGCWEWTAFKDRNGYGHIMLPSKPNKKKLFAHRVSYAIANGGIKAGAFCLHKCDNPGCVNPSHLTSGTQADNMRDMHIKGRDRTTRGSQRKNAILTEDKVSEILRMRASGVRITVIATTFRIPYRLAQRVIYREKWSHVPMPKECLA